MRVPFVALVPRLRIAAATAVAVAASSSLLTAQINRNFEGAVDQRLSEVAVAGDVDHDGIDDLVISAPNEWSAHGIGAVYVYSGADGSTLLELRADDSQAPGLSHLGWAVSGQTDFDGDGYDDLVLGDPRVPSRSYWFPDVKGAVGVYSIHLDAWLTVVFADFWEADWLHAGDPGHISLGYSVAGAGDLNGDGFDEVITGAPDAGTDGAALVLDWTDPLNGGWVGPAVGSAGAGIAFGTAVTVGGDWDSDGIEDIVVGAPYFDTDQKNGQIDNGAVYVFSGATHGFVVSWTSRALFGFDQPHQYLGDSLARIGDVDGDGNSEIVVGAPYYDDTVFGMTDVGFASIVSPRSQLPIATAWGDLDGMYLGASVTGVGDVNGDGILDFAAGAPEWNGKAGLAAVYSGIDAAPLHQYGFSHPSSSGLDSYYGRRICGGDLDHDGFGDLIVCGSGWDEPDHRGLVDVWMGAPALTFSYGTGWPGILMPTIDTPFPAVPGKLFEVHINSSSTKDLGGLFLIGVEEAKIPFKKGGTLLLLPAVVAPIDIKGSLLILSDTLPDDPALYGADYFLQAALFDAAAVGGIAFTAGQHVQIGFVYP